MKTHGSDRSRTRQAVGLRLINSYYFFSEPGVSLSVVMLRFVRGCRLLPALATCVTSACAVSSGGHRFDVAPSLTPLAAGVSVRLRADSAAAPRGDQIVAGWMGSVLGGFLAWRLFDEPDGQHTKVHNGWGYTPRALTALAIGSHVGTTAGVWARGRAIGSRGSLLFTAVGAALPTIPVLKRSDDPLLMLKVVPLWAPLQGYMGYTGYRVGTKRSPAAPDESVATNDDPRPR